MAFRTIMLLLLAVAFGSILASAQGDDFRVETKVFSGKDTEKPAFETLTVFSGDVVYDFVLTGQTDQIASKLVTVFDKRRGRIVLLDGIRQMQTTLTTQELADFTAAIRRRATDGAAGGLFNPVFTVAYVEADQQVTMTSDVLTYRVAGEIPQDATAAARYSDFADWFARLNAARGNVPPFGRIELNRILKEKGLLPVRVERTAVRNRKKMTARSEHASNWTLSNTDRRRIEHAGQMMAELPTVSLKEYWGVKNEVAARQ